MTSNYYITDPAYVLDDDVRIRLMEGLNLNISTHLDEYHERLAEALEEKSGAKAFVNRTGNSDGGYNIYYNGRYHDDSGTDTCTMAIFKVYQEATDRLNKLIDGAKCIIGLSDDFTVEFDTSSKQKTLLKITDHKTDAVYTNYATEKTHKYPEPDEPGFIDSYANFCDFLSKKMSEGYTIFSIPTYATGILTNWHNDGTYGCPEDKIEVCEKFHELYELIAPVITAYNGSDPEDEMFVSEFFGPEMTPCIDYLCIKRDEPNKISDKN